MGAIKIVSKTGIETKGNTVSNTALALSHASWSWTAAKLAAATSARISANANGIVVTYDGTTPTATLGHPIAAGETLVLEGGAAVNNLKMIRSGGSDATVTVTLEK